MKRETTVVISIVLALVLIGVLMVYSASAVGGDPLGLLKRQVFFLTIGLVLMFLMVRFDYHRFADPGMYRGIVLAAAILLFLVLFFGSTVEGARRWLRIGPFSFQPSEFAKFALILLLAVKLTENREHTQRFFKGFMPPVLLACVFAVLVLAERDLGVPAMMISVAGLMMFMAGVRWYYLAMSMAPGAAGLFALVVLAPHRFRRLLAFVNPWEYHDGAGWQLIQSYSGFARGSLLGQGVGAGEQKLGYLPAAHTDFIFSVIGEELGLFGTLTVVVLFAVLMWTMYKIAMHAADHFGALLAAGIGGLISLQAAFIMAVTTGLLPTKGLPLPFISYGGTSLVVFLAMAGVVVNVGIQARAPEPKRVLVHTMGASACAS